VLGAALDLDLHLDLVNFTTDEWWTPVGVRGSIAAMACASVSKTTMQVPVPLPSFIHRPFSNPS